MMFSLLLNEGMFTETFILFGGYNEDFLDDGQIKWLKTFNDFMW